MYGSNLLVSGVVSHDGDRSTKWDVLNSVGVFIISDVMDRLSGTSVGERQRSTSVLFGFLPTI